MINLFRPSIDEAEIRAVSEVLRSGWLGFGPKVAEFEKNFAAYTGIPEAVAVNSGTSALYLAVRLLDIGPGDEVIVPTLTFASTAHAVAQCGATPVFVDVDPGTFNITAAAVAAALTARTRAVMVVHYGGYPVDMDGIRAAAPGVPIIEDCAHACGTSMAGKKAGSLGTIGCFSFNATKNLAAGDGGAITCSDPQMAKRARELRWLGLRKDTWTRVNSSDVAAEEAEEISLKFQMTDITAAIAGEQLKKLDALNRLRAVIAARYDEAFRGHASVRTRSALPAEVVSSHHLYSILVPRRNELRKYLLEHDIYAGVHYRPLHRLQCYATGTSLPIAERLYSELLSLPLYPQLSAEDCDAVIHAIQAFYNL